MQITATVKEILSPKVGMSKKGTPWKSQEFVFAIIEGYKEQLMVAEVFGEDKLNVFAIKKGEVLALNVNFDAREWNGRWYNSIRVFSVSRGQAQPQPQAKPTPAPTPQPPVENTNGNLPF